MPSRSSLREYHLLIVRHEAGFGWEIRYNKHAKPVQISDRTFGSREEAEQKGSLALRTLKADLPGGAAPPRGL